MVQAYTFQPRLKMYKQKDTVFRQEVIILQDSSSENQPLLVHRNASDTNYLLF
jgi:hypothetical protein